MYILIFYELGYRFLTKKKKKKELSVCLLRSVTSHSCSDDPGSDPDQLRLQEK